jgi:hypothetical protein
MNMRREVPKGLNIGEHSYTARFLAHWKPTEMCFASLDNDQAKLPQNALHFRRTKDFHISVSRDWEHTDWLVVYFTTFSVTRPYSVDDMVISEWRWMEKNLVGSGGILIQGTMPKFAWRDWGKSKTSNSIGCRRDWDLNPGSPEYKAGVLTTRQLCSMIAHRSHGGKTRYCQYNVVVKWLTILPCFWEVQDWNLDLEVGYLDCVFRAFSQFLQAHSRTVP